MDSVPMPIVFDYKERFEIFLCEAVKVGWVKDLAVFTDHVLFFL
jgi:hypothetical protein